MYQFNVYERALLLFFGYFASEDHHRHLLVLLWNRVEKERIGRHSNRNLSLEELADDHAGLCYSLTILIIFIHLLEIKDLTIFIF